MDRQEKQLRNWKAVAATFAAITFLLALVLVIAGVKNIIGSVTGKPVETQAPTAASSETEITESAVPSEETEITETTEAEEVDMLSLWTAGAESKEALVSYVEAVTDENSPDYIPVEDRIAVFDMDGTILCETDPYYFDHCLLRTPKIVTGDSIFLTDVIYENPEDTVIGGVKNFVNIDIDNLVYDIANHLNRGVTESACCVLAVLES